MRKKLKKQSSKNKKIEKFMKRRKWKKMQLNKKNIKMQNSYVNIVMLFLKQTNRNSTNSLIVLIYLAFSFSLHFLFSLSTYRL